jgi:hypothetical protein
LDSHAPVHNHVSFLFSGDIGGSIGLFVGASILTIFEILDTIFHTLARHSASEHQKKKNDKINKRNKPAISPTSDRQIARIRDSTGTTVRPNGRNNLDKNIPPGDTYV